MPLDLLPNLLDRRDHPLDRFLQPHRLFSGSTLSSHLADLEAVVGLFLALYMAGAVIVAGGIWVFVGIPRQNPSISAFASVFLAWLLAAMLEFKSANLIAGVKRLPNPRPVHLAIAQPPTALFLRPFVAAWWLANAAAMILMIEMFRKGASQGPSPDTDHELFIQTVNWAIIIGSTYASNTFLILAAGALLNRERFLLWLWRLRLILDVLIIVAIPPAVRFLIHH